MFQNMHATLDINGVTVIPSAASGEYDEHDADTFDGKC